MPKGGNEEVGSLKQDDNETRLLHLLWTTTEKEVFEMEQQMGNFLLRPCSALCREWQVENEISPSIAHI